MTRMSPPTPPLEKLRRGVQIERCPSERMQLSSVALLALCSFAAGFEAPVEAGATVLVTGATGRTGSLLYAKLKADSRIGTVRALVTSIEKARSTLKCTKCDASEGIFLGNVTQPSTLTAAMKGVSTVAITVGAGPNTSPDLQHAIEFTGVQNQVRALAAGGGAYARRTRQNVRHRISQPRCQCA